MGQLGSVTSNASIGTPKLHTAKTGVVDKIFTSGIFPSQLKQGKIFPLFTKGERVMLSNYFPITILPFFSKLLEKLIFKRLISHLNKFDLLTSKQFGFRASYSTELALIPLTDAMKTFMNKGFWSEALFIDFTKAFDTINHNILVCIGIARNMWARLKPFAQLFG